jgi:hypothetical protein
MNHAKQLLTVLWLSTFLMSCTAVHYRSPALAEDAAFHQKVAVLPFEMILTGKQPVGLSPDQIAEIEEYESLGFQTSLYYAMLDRADAGRNHRIYIDLQSVEDTNDILWENGISVRDSWVMDPQVLAEILGVDAVVRTQVEKTRYLSNAASYGIDLGAHVLYEVTEGRFGEFIPHGLIKTHDIYADASLLDGGDGELLWKVAVHRDADWTRPANDVIAGVTRKLAKKFPYQT